MYMMIRLCVDFALLAETTHKKKKSAALPMAFNLSTA
jgi:hypothetical protein